MYVYKAALETKEDGLFQDVFRRACSYIPCGVSIVTGCDPLGGPFGLTVSSLAVVSFEPPMVSLCIDRSSKRVEHLRRTQRFAVNLLRCEQASLASLFATPGADRFKKLRWHAAEDGAPILDGTLGTLLCGLRNDFEAGDHQIFFGQVNRLSLRGGEPLVHWRRAFHRLRLDYPFLESQAALDSFVHRWEAGALPRTDWTHGAHVCMAAYFAFDHEAEALFTKMKTGIIHHNECVGTANTEDNGYHETLTRFWAGTVGDFVRNGRFSSRFEAVKSAMRMFGEDRDRCQLYYSFDVVRDRQARREWILPDRQPPIALTGA